MSRNRSKRSPKQSKLNKQTKLNKPKRLKPPDEPYWNHRVVRDGGAFYFVEAHYNAGERKPHSMTVSPLAPQEDSLKDLELTLKRLLKALKRPILKAEDIA
jgi:hypothetical protein